VKPGVKQTLYFNLFKLTGLVSLGILVIVLLYVIHLGSGVISIRFLTHLWVNSDITAGGIYPAIVGTFCLGVGVAVFSIPVGVACAVYLNEYAGHSFLVRMIRLAIRNLAGVPSIIYGLFGFAVFVQMLNFGTSIIAASLTLSGMTIPWVRPHPSSWSEQPFICGDCPVPPLTSSWLCRITCSYLPPSMFTPWPRHTRQARHWSW
jgi:phosphate transport system permease protein